MADYVLSNKADTDLSDIYVFSWNSFGEKLADSYIQSLIALLETLAANPLLGHAAGDIIPDLRSHQHASHTIFYMVEKNGIFVVRILHRSMDSERHLGPENA
jgi:toxin ParE1/3/4